MERKSKYLGSGIFMMQQYSTTELVKGDFCWDADWGYIKWDGKEWKQFNPK